MLRVAGRRVMGSAPSAARALGVSLQQTRFKSDEAAPVADYEPATGLEKVELDAINAGVEDPFQMKGLSGYFGTKYRPSAVPMFFDERLVGCIGPSHAEHELCWVNVKVGEMSRCYVCAQAFAGYKVTGRFYPPVLEFPEPKAEKQ
eukprot:CAMPEP_0204569964 /NCGR_PEP_ID=MMETSP0661-20131031/38054_1 /ASSEMBLY_ACC=CAM_ASM_000606 /TAXON_ID=109239 /ORGANISM="Alexandrium margalefi, Strain AMGDE01CS-322" /LENGTH=145 /DNA_ID=CAMNT_0051578121 /DNA_START=29 /DNA_END=466 /DNA_ORIENTATION=+